MSADTAEREALAERILADARARAASIPDRYRGAQVNVMAAAQRQARKALTGELRYWRAAQQKPCVVAKASTEPATQRTRAAPVPRDLRASRHDPGAAPPRRRPCLCCRRTFESAGPGNRLCGTCRGRSSDVSPYAI